MDDLFDVLIESGGEKYTQPFVSTVNLGHHKGIMIWSCSRLVFCSCFVEISPFVKQDPPNLDRLLPVTANITTLPISTVLSRPPPQIQVAQLPAPPLNPPSSLVTLGTDNQLETLLVGTLVADTEPRTLRLMEELHSQLNPHSPMDTMELDFNDNTPTSAFHLQNTNLDNMDWLDLTMPVPAEGVNSLGSSSPVGVFPSEFLDSHELQLNWD